ncbi:hypothetical protein Scep_009630 [Stephania cephalantha]|uniref:Uncharacterized protein n=1 Tax=Stephania cephalantha TaxID=152367 RepID=A0AAP0JU75_9MAGN
MRQLTRGGPPLVQRFTAARLRQFFLQSPAATHVGRSTYSKSVLSSRVQRVRQPILQFLTHSIRCPDMSWDAQTKRGAFEILRFSWRMRSRVIPTAVPRNLSTSSYEKRKNAAQK